MTYYNIVLRAGHRRMARTLADAGVSGAIVPDLPLDELDGWGEQADEAGVATVLLVAPTTPEARLKAICARSRGFVYGVGVMGVTGERESVGSSALEVAARCKQESDTPVLIGVGISTPQQAREVVAVADGVVVGSALVHRLLEGAGPDGAAEFVAGIRAAIGP
jgi:tryptophan synthase alpha chain